MAVVLATIGLGACQRSSSSDESNAADCTLDFPSFIADSLTAGEIRGLDRSSAPELKVFGAVRDSSMTMVAICSSRPGFLRTSPKLTDGNVELASGGGALNEGTNGTASYLIYASSVGSTIDVDLDGETLARVAFPPNHETECGPGGATFEWVGCESILTLILRADLGIQGSQIIGVDGAVTDVRGDNPLGFYFLGAEDDGSSASRLTVAFQKPTSDRVVLSIRHVYGATLSKQIDLRPLTIAIP
jgi:hypothetical protein